MKAAMIQLPNILQFRPQLFPMIWGGHSLARYKGIEAECDNIGESWEVSAVPGKESVVSGGLLDGMTVSDLVSCYGSALLGTCSEARYGLKFPLLIKFIDADADLSIQVHPSDELAASRHNSLGKTEMWYVIETRPGAVIKAGLREQLDPDSYRRRVADGTFAEAVQGYEAAPGQSYFIPAGRVHAICAGNLLAEIQETSDITYRIFDYNRRDKNGNLRRLHTAEAADAIDYTVLPDYRNTPRVTGPDTEEIVACDHFRVDKIELSSSSHPVAPRGESFVVVMCIGGTARLTSGSDSVELRRGHTALLPAAAPESEVSGTATLLVVRV